LIPEGKCELPVEVFKKLRTFFLIEMHEDFSVCVCVKLMPSGHKILPEIRIIKDFTIVDDPDGPILIVDRLITPGQIDNTQPCMCQADLLVEVYPEGIGTPVSNHSQHLPE
jgi:hypothetical protein